jgi:arylsulfatase
MTSVGIVVLDTLGKDTFDDHFDWLPGTRFECCFSTSHWTVPAHASLFSGKYASEIGTHAKSPSYPSDHPTLAESLGDGYTSRFYSANPQMAYHDGWTRGFDEVMSPWEIKQPDSTHLVDWGDFAIRCTETGWRRYVRAVETAIRNDGSTLASLKKGYDVSIQDRTDIDDSGASSILRRIRETEFGSEELVFVNLMEAHTPYDPPEAFQSVEVDANPAFVDSWSGVPDESSVRQAYDDSVRYLSHIYRDIFEELNDALDYVITLSDHGELLGEHGYWNHVYGLYPELVHVPLVVSGPGFPTGVRDAPMSILDVHGTVVDICDAPTESRGVSLRDESFEPEPRYTECHGLPRWVSAQMERNGIAEEFDRHDRRLFGVSTPEGEYGYEVLDGFEGDLDESTTVDLLSSFKEAVVPDEMHHADSGVDGAVADRLEHLGYA